MADWTTFTHTGPLQERRSADTGSLRDSLRHSAANVDRFEQLLTDAASALQEHADAQFVAWYTSGGDRIGEQPSLTGLLFAESGLPDDLRELCLQSGHGAIESGRLTTVTAAERHVVCTATVFPQRPGTSLMMLTSASNADVPRLEAASALDTVAMILETWLLNESLRKAEAETLHVARLVDLVARIESAPNLTAGCRTLADNLAETFAVKQVFVGICGDESRKCRLTAVSDSEQFDEQSEFSRLATAALQETLAREETSRWPPEATDRRHALRAHQQFLEYAAGTKLVSHPLLDQHEKPCGAVMVLHDGGSDDTRVVDESQTTAFLRAAEQPLAVALQLLQRADENPLRRLWNRTRASYRAKRLRTILLVAGVAACLLAVPAPFRISCECDVQPIKRRFVAAPFDGPLKESLVRPGDIVRKDDLLARMDGLDIRLELAGTQADLNRAMKQRSGHIALHESGDAAIARYEAERLQLRTQLLQRHQGSLEIRSPIDGVVVTGDHEKAEGVPLSTGQTLFEIAPLDAMSIELSIPEDRIRHVRAGSEVRITLDAFPGRIWTGRLLRVHPRAEVIDHENVFVAEVEIPNPSGQLRPGMHGHARIASGYSPVGWIILRDAWGSIVTWLRL